MRPLLDGSVRLMLQEAGRGFSLDVDGGGFLVGFELFSLTLFGFDGGVFLTFETQPTGFATDGGDPADDGVDVLRFFNGRGKIGTDEGTALFQLANGPSRDGIAMGVDTLIDIVFGDETRVPG